MSKKRVIIVGGGFGGLNCLQKLKNTDFEILLVDKKNHHLFQPLLYQVASAALSPADIATPLREIAACQKNVTVIMGNVLEVNKNEKKIILENGDKHFFDFLVLAVGASHTYFGNDHWEPFAPGLKTIDNALYIRERVLISFEKAERINSNEKSEQYLNFIIIGGGPTGVEMAGAIAEIAHKAMLKNFRYIDPKKAKIFLIEGLEYILPSYPKSLSLRAKKDLEKMGVNVITGSQVTDINKDGVTVNNTLIPSENIVWAAGNKASALLKTLNVPLDKQSRVIVESDLTIPNEPNIFVIGDGACLYDKKGIPLPSVAPTAIQQGRYVGKILKKRTRKDKRLPFRYFDKGSIATIGKNKAVGFFRFIHLKGIIAWLIWGVIHVFYLVSYRNKMAVSLDWLFHYVTGLRGARLINKNIDDEFPKKKSPFDDKEL